jgi:probable HAF family extracellular repeat protein
MTNKLFPTLAILAVASFAGQAPQSMAQSEPVPDGISPIALFWNHRLRVPRKPQAVVRQSTDSQQDAVAQGMAKTKVYKFRTVDYPAATNTPIFDYNDGTAVGYFIFGSSDTTAFYYKGTTNHTLTVPGSSDGVLSGINVHGQMVGGYDDPKGSHGFLYDGKNFTTLDFPNSIYTGPSGINSSGEIVGSFFGNNQIVHGFLYANGTFTQLDCPNSGATFASGINSSGEIVGSCYYNSAYHGFLLTNKVYTAIDFPGAESTNANGINDAGAIAGNYQDATTTHGFTYISGVFTQVDVGGGAVATVLNRITNAKNVVGYYQDSVGELHGVIGK